MPFEADKNTDFLLSFSYSWVNDVKYSVFVSGGDGVLNVVVVCIIVI